MQHLVSLYYAPDMQSVAPAPYSLAQVSDYISYARANVNPVISDEACTELVTVGACWCRWSASPPPPLPVCPSPSCLPPALGCSSHPTTPNYPPTAHTHPHPSTPPSYLRPTRHPSIRPRLYPPPSPLPPFLGAGCCAASQGYVKMRQQGLRGGKKVITATPRQLESLIRLAEAHARAHLRDVVSGEDVREAIRLIKVATQQAATDPKTGTIDMNLITTGVPTQAFDEAGAGAGDEFGRDDF